jgi:uridine kinase
MDEHIMQDTGIPRSVLIRQLAAAILQLPAHEPTLVAIDGRSAAGKTTFADELAGWIGSHGRPILRSSLDDFHPPGHKYRSRERRYTPQSYIAEGYDYEAFRRCVLEPLERGGNRRCRLALWDSFNDRPFPEQWTDAPRNVVAIIDGGFLLRPDFRHYWDYTIWLHIAWDTMIERAAQRDVAWVGSTEIVVERYRSFWIPTHTFYETEQDPTLVANVIIDNTHPQTPSLTTTDRRKE